MEGPTWPGTEGGSQFNTLQGTENLEADPAQVKPSHTLTAFVENLGWETQLSYVWIPDSIETVG